jgi:hypothetical protein
MVRTHKRLDAQGLIYDIPTNQFVAGWISAIIASLFGAGEEVERILEEE